MKRPRFKRKSSLSEKERKRRKREFFLILIILFVVALLTFVESRIINFGADIAVSWVPKFGPNWSLPLYP
jgi:two-component system nitrogen regulation sensor histidine kinase NtrY